MEEDNSFCVIASISSSPFLCVLKKWTFYYLQINSQENALVSPFSFTIWEGFENSEPLPFSLAGLSMETRVRTDMIS